MHSIQVLCHPTEKNCNNRENDLILERVESFPYLSAIVTERADWSVEIKQDWLKQENTEKERDQ